MIITSSENQVYNKTMPQVLNACGIVLLYINSHMYSVKRRPSPMHVAASLLTDTEYIILINNSLHVIQSSSLDAYIQDILQEQLYQLRCGHSYGIPIP